MESSQPYAYPQDIGFLKRLSVPDWIHAAVLVTAVLLALHRYGSHMDHYEKALLALAAPTFAWLGWHWTQARRLMALLAVLALAAIAMYGGVPEMADRKFFLKYFLSSQSAILWMSALFVLATLFYWLSLALRSETGAVIGSRLCWAAVALGFTGMLVRWYESYLIGADIGHIPVSNLYEVFILFCVITALFYLYYEERYATRQLGAFVLPVITAAVGFLLWYTLARDAAGIQPLVPALQSWWMKIHVPANFIGYGAFALAAMVAMAYLFKSSGWLADRLPSLEVLDDVMYQAITVGFAFFTIATILGALWAAEAWAVTGLGIQKKPGR